MANYSYSVSGDLSNGLDINCLHKAINEYGFATPFDGINLEGDNISVMFTGALSPTDQSDLDTIISNHNPDNCTEESDIGYAIGVAGHAVSEVQSSTTSQTPVRKLRLTITDLPEGEYRIGWYFEWALSSGSYDFRSQVQINDSDTLMYQSQEPKDADTDQNMPVSGFAYRSLTSGDYNIDLDYWSERYTAYIQRARLEIWRVE